MPSQLSICVKLALNRCPWDTIYAMQQPLQSKYAILQSMCIWHTLLS